MPTRRSHELHSRWLSPRSGLIALRPGLASSRLGVPSLALAAVLSLTASLSAQTLFAAGQPLQAQPSPLLQYPDMQDASALAQTLRRNAGPAPVVTLASVEPMRFLPADDADEASSSVAPRAFGPQQTSAQPTPLGKPQQSPDQPSKRILGIVPNYRAVGVGAKLPPQSVKEKFVTASEDTFDYSALALAVLVAGYSDASAATPEFGHGGIAFGRYLWHSFVDQSIENYSVEFIVPALTREDTRYYTLGSGGFKKRSIYALTRLVIVRTDSGHETVNLSELLGAGLGAGVSNFYYPRPERTAGKTLGKYATNLGIDAASYFIREFDTEISRIMSPRHKGADPR